MGITLVIVGGITLISVLGMLFDYKVKKNAGADPKLEKRIAALESRQAVLENALAEKEEKIARLTEEVSFVNRLLDKK